VVDKQDLNLTIEEYFSKAYNDVPGNIRSHISKVMDAVNLTVPIDRKIGDLSGGQQARILLAFALIQNPDILLLDEPTNHLDIDAREIIETAFLNYDGAILAISHDRYFYKKNCSKIIKNRKSNN